MKKSRKQFCEIIMKKSERLEFIARQAKIIRPGKSTGPLTGGCLTLLCRSLRTPYEIQTQEKILLIEDVNERPYRVDGMLWQLKTAGKFKHVRGVVFGEMINCHPPKGEHYAIRDTIAEFFKDADFPVIMNCPIGHGKEMWTLPIGVVAELDAEAKSLTLKDHGVI